MIKIEKPRRKMQRSEESLTNQDAAKILDLIMRETGRNEETIVIQAKAV